MTWHFKIDPENMTMDVWDHLAGTGDTPIATEGLDSPRTRSNEQVVKDVMAAEIDAAVEAGDVDRAVRIARDGSTDQIERGKP